MTDLSNLLDDPFPTGPLPRFEAARVSDDGKTVGLFLLERNGTVSAIEIGVNELADKLSPITSN